MGQGSYQSHQWREMTKNNNWIKELLEEFGKLYQDYLAECDVYDGASLWSNERCQEILNQLSQQRQQIIEMVKGMKIGKKNWGRFDKELNHHRLGYNQALNDLIQQLENKEKYGINK